MKNSKSFTREMELNSIKSKSKTMIYKDRFRVLFSPKLPQIFQYSYNEDDNWITCSRTQFIHRIQKFNTI
jgi:hypothetical protein